MHVTETRDDLQTVRGHFVISNFAINAYALAVPKIYHVFFSIPNHVFVYFLLK